MSKPRSLKAGALISTGAAIPILLAAGPAFAYVGPGAGLSVVGTVLALLAAIGLALVGFVWYPVKRLRQKKRLQEGDRQPQQAPQPSQRQ